MSELLQGDVTSDDGEPPSPDIIECIERIAMCKPGEEIVCNEAVVTAEEYAVRVILGGTSLRTYMTIWLQWEGNRLASLATHTLQGLSRQRAIPGYTVAICNHTPLLFGPLGGMVSGYHTNEGLDDDYALVNERIVLESHDIASAEERAVLLGGLAVVVWASAQDSAESIPWHQARDDLWRAGLITSETASAVWTSPLPRPGIS